MSHVHGVAPAAVHDLAGAIAVLRSRGLRISAARRLVLEALFSADGPVTADELAAGTSALPPSDIASTYRNLETLEQAGLVRHLHLGHGPGRWVLTVGAEHEYVACEACGAITALPPARLDPVRELVRELTGHVVSFGHVPIVGRCSTCAAAETGAGGGADTHEGGTHDVHV